MVEKPAERSAEIPCWSDTRLVQECLEGNADAWSVLIGKYKNLIYSLPLRRGFSQADASDIFQSVVAQLLSELGRLREPRALTAWLVQVTLHKCSERKRQQLRENGNGMAAGPHADASAGTPTPEALILHANREQILHQALRSASPRCRELIRMLFFEESTRSYAEVASNLGIATGSIGFIRRRCLEHLRKLLEEAGFTS